VLRAALHHKPGTPLFVMAGVIPNERVISWSRDFAILVGYGLMALLFYSSRKGFDASGFGLTRAVRVSRIFLRIRAKAMYLKCYDNSRRLGQKLPPETVHV
jgi:hypothetical protein